MPAASAGLPSSTPRTRTPSRSGRPTDRRSRRATCDGAMATPSRARVGRLAAAQRVDPRAQRGVGRQGEVEALADPVGVEADEPAVRVDERAARRTRAPAARCARRCRRCAGRPGPRNARATAETRPNVTRRPAAVRGRGAEDGACRSSSAAPSPQASGGGAGRVDLDDREVAVAVDAGDGAARPPAVGEGDGDLVAAQVVGVGQDRAVGDDDAGAAGAAADPDDGWADALGDGGDGGLEFLDGAHVAWCSASVRALDRRMAAIDL